jgi:hypothetical protein
MIQEAFDWTETYFILIPMLQTWKTPADLIFLLIDSEIFGGFFKERRPAKVISGSYPWSFHNIHFFILLLVP